MRVKQVSAFIENQPGKLADALTALSQNGINIRALSIADTVDYGILRLILSDVDKGVEALRKTGAPVHIAEVLQVDVPDVPGGLNDALVKPLAKAGINVEYMYAHILPAPGKATVMVKVRDIDRAEKALGIKAG